MVAENNVIEFNKDLEFEALEEVVAPSWAYVGGFLAGVGVVGGAVGVGILLT